MTVNKTELEDAVKAFQGGNVLAFEELYTLLEGNKWATVRWLRRKTPSAVALADCYALYDDALYIAASNYCSTGGASFTTYFRNVLNKRRLSLLQHTFSQKRHSLSGVTNIDTVDHSELIEQCFEDAQPWQYERYLNTVDQLKEIELTEQEQLWLLWLCSFDPDTLKPFISIVLK